MKYDWNNPLLPGTIVCAHFSTFESEEKIGLFMVLYDEQLDSNVTDDKNVIAIKLSTQNTCVSNYSVQVDTNLNNFLNESCIACCSKLHVLHKKGQIYKVLGIVHPATYHRVYKTFMKFNGTLQTQLINNL